MSSTRKRYRILMVEDSRVSLEVYAQRLERRGYQVATAISAEEARAELEVGVPDLILLDVFMPKVSGFEFLRELRADPKTSRVPIILISALSDTQHIVEGLELGANDYVTKPIVMPILTARMEALLRSSELVRRLEVQTELLSKLAAFDDLTGGAQPLPALRAKSRDFNGRYRSLQASERRARPFARGSGAALGGDDPTK